MPAALNTEDLSEVRARYIAECGWGSFDAVLASFRERDDTLKAYRDYARIVLWFEHDLYDQLQLLQILCWFSSRERRHDHLYLINPDRYLGTMTSDQLSALTSIARPVSQVQLELARLAWDAFRAPEPSAWAALLKTDTSALPFLATTVLRHLEQYPSITNGLNRTEYQLLEAVQAGKHRPGEIFARNQDLDQIMFMGDTVFWHYLNTMAESEPPLVTVNGGQKFGFPSSYPYSEAFKAQRIEITNAGRRVLDTKLDWLSIAPIDKWLGGVHLQPGKVWRWDAAERQLSMTKA